MPRFLLFQILKDDATHGDDVACGIAFGLEMVQQQDKSMLYPTKGIYIGLEGLIYLEAVKRITHCFRRAFLRALYSSAKH
jgi:hypothetical protein